MQLEDISTQCTLIHKESPGFFSIASQMLRLKHAFAHVALTPRIQSLVFKHQPLAQCVAALEAYKSSHLEDSHSSCISDLSVCR